MLPILVLLIACQKSSSSVIFGQPNFSQLQSLQCFGNWYLHFSKCPVVFSGNGIGNDNIRDRDEFPWDAFCGSSLLRRCGRGGWCHITKRVQGTRSLKVPGSQCSLVVEFRKLHFQVFFLILFFRSLLCHLFSILSYQIAHAGVFVASVCFVCASYV